MKERGPAAARIGGMTKTYSICERLAPGEMSLNVRHWGVPGAPALSMLHGWMDCSITFRFVALIPIDDAHGPQTAQNRPVNGGGTFDPISSGFWHGTWIDAERRAAGALKMPLRSRTAITTGAFR